MPNESGRHTKLFVHLNNEGYKICLKLTFNICMLRYIYIVTAKRELEIVKIFQAMYVLRH